MNVDDEVAKQVQDDRAWKEGRRRWAQFCTRVSLSVLVVGAVAAVLGSLIVGEMKADAVRPRMCKESFGYRVAGVGYSETTCDHPAHRMEIKEVKKPTPEESGLFEIRCTCDPRKAALMTCDPRPLPEIEKAYQGWKGTVQDRTPEPVDDITGAR